MADLDERLERVSLVRTVHLVTVVAWAGPGLLRLRLLAHLVDGKVRIAASEKSVHAGVPRLDNVHN